MLEKNAEYKIYLDGTQLHYGDSDEWYHINKELDRFEINEDAPEEAKISFEKWKKENKLDY